MLLLAAQRFDSDEALNFVASRKNAWYALRMGRKKLRLTLEDGQKFRFCVSFSWLRKSDDLYRLQEIYVEVPWKNRKSLIAASLGIFMFCADVEHGA
ncbi:hypothetical protein AFK62_20205 (plasmid) [Cronobacter condimenti 1330]|uniref:Phage terminase large subunit n=3 Tax=Cronobacter condimenti TaxID=1163710 RepID=A0ABM5VI82_9ENTR|nr:hypothetical protein AFK62_20205 [Cronobacter condimenti 1330]